MFGERYFLANCGKDQSTPTFRMPETNSNMRPDFEDAFNVTYGKVLTCTRGSFDVHCFLIPVLNDGLQTTLTASS